ncbi:hypothetical protein KDL29_11560 [bacterium]|nr:hypothetical protein [bacterium]
MREETGDKFNWLFVATDDIGDPKQLVTDKGWPAEVFAMSEGGDIKDFHDGANPTTYFYDSSGKQVDKMVGSMTLAELREKVAGLN